LARFQLPGIPPKLLQAMKEKSGQPFGSLSTQQFHLIESKLKPTGAEYTTLQTFLFATEA
jgi:2'-5' RNA ligase